MAIKLNFRIIESWRLFDGWRWILILWIFSIISKTIRYCRIYKSIMAYYWLVGLEFWYMELRNIIVILFLDLKLNNINLYKLNSFKRKIFNHKLSSLNWNINYRKIKYLINFKFIKILIFNKQIISYKIHLV